MKEALKTIRLHVLWAVFVFGTWHCVNSNRQATLKQAIETTISASDVTYGMAVELCDKREKAIIARPPTTLEQDKEDLAHVRETCDRIFKVFEDTRRLNLLMSELEML